MTRYYLDTSVLVERWAGEQRIVDEIKELLGQGQHVTSTHVLREWKHIVHGATAEVLNALKDRPADLGTLLARLSQGWGRQPGQRLRLLAMLTNNENALGPELQIRAEQMLRYRAATMFEHHIDELRNGSECGLATNEVFADADGNYRLKDTCKKSETICRQDQLVQDELPRWRSLAHALVGHSARSADRKMGTLAERLARSDPRERKGKNCYGRTGDVSVALECASETLLTTDASFDSLAKGGNFPVKRLAPTSPP